MRLLRKGKINPESSRSRTFARASWLEGKGGEKE